MRRVFAVHPRACGEQASHVLVVADELGSSPRLRGTAEIGGPLDPLGTVHPRACGEQKDEDILTYVIRGSSPRLRGTVIPGGLGQPTRGSSPRLREQRLRQVLRVVVGVHPRACGEQRVVLQP